MKLISWNVNGIRACLGRNFAEAFDNFDADIICLQEVKAEQSQVEFTPPGYHIYWNAAQKKGYSGTAVFTRMQPLSVRYGDDNEGRMIILEFAEFILVNVYTPNSRDGLVRLDYRIAWEDNFRACMSELDKCKPVLICGDLNVAHREIDLARPGPNRRNPGFTDEERGKMTELLTAGFVDTFRYFYPDKPHMYSWWSYRAGARERNVGWRIDYWLCSQRFTPRLASAAILADVYGSDHCPVSLEVRA